ncbi:MAG: DUF1080 domain-containing protein [Chitinophagaceae bacterium]|jgi:hypothetical protein|nr:DUF1080 domain-containing protein [Sediminibacterium sp.]
MKKTILGLAMIFIIAGTVNAQKKFASWQDSIAYEASLSEIWTPVPKAVMPGNFISEPPSDAIILYNGKDLSAFHGRNGKKIGWVLEPDGALTDVKGAGDIITNESFGDCQLHLEFRTPSVVKGAGQSRGNSGVFLMGQYEIQILDSYQNPTYVNGQAAAVYKQHIPLVNASRPPGNWQAYDIIFTAPRFNADGTLLSPARVTLLHNGVLVQNNVSLIGPTDWVIKPVYKKHADKLPLFFQDHGDDGNPISLRNIWIRPL